MIRDDDLNEWERRCSHQFFDDQADVIIIELCKALRAERKWSAECEKALKFYRNPELWEGSEFKPATLVAGIYTAKEVLAMKKDILGE